MTHLDWRLVILVAALACRAPDSHREAHRASVPRGIANTTTRECPRPFRGIIIGHDTVAGFSTRATLGALRRVCGAGDTTLYDAVGWQAVAWTFPFAGARVTAVQSQHGYGESVHDDEIPDLWVAEGDSVRSLDDSLVPRTLGALRAQYGFTIVDENSDGDDFDGPHARVCRYPYLLFALAVDDTARHVPDSARVTRVDMDTPGPDTTMKRYCAAREAS